MTPSRSTSYLRCNEGTIVGDSMGVRYLSKDQTAWTSGLRSYGHPELRAVAGQSSSIVEVVAFLEYVATYILQYGARIHPGETLAYGYWLTRFDRVKRGMLEASELDDEAETFVRGIRDRCRSGVINTVFVTVSGPSSALPSSANSVSSLMGCMRAIRSRVFGIHLPNRCQGGGSRLTDTTATSTR